MSALSVIRKGVIGVAAVVIPGIASGPAALYSPLGILSPSSDFWGLLGIGYVLVGIFAAACVRVAHFSTRLAVVLTTLPSGVALLVWTGWMMPDSIRDVDYVVLLYWLVVWCVALGGAVAAALVGIGVVRWRPAESQTADPEDEVAVRMEQ